MDTAAQLIALAGGDIQPVADAVAQLGAVAAAARRAVVAGGNDLVIAHNQSAVSGAQTGGALQYGLSNVEIIVFLVDAAHWNPASSIGKIAALYTAF